MVRDNRETQDTERQMKDTTPSLHSDTQHQRVRHHQTWWRDGRQ